MNTCCVGHECDDCPICQNGTCCKRDLPASTLPPPRGSWPELHGEIGVLEVGDDYVQCHACGKLFKAMCSHMQMIHGLSKRDYCSVFGLRQGTSLACRRSRKKFYERAMEKIEAGVLRADSVELARWRSERTPEQLQEMARRARWDTSALEDRLRAAAEDYFSTRGSVRAICSKHGVSERLLKRRLTETGAYMRNRVDKRTPVEHGTPQRYQVWKCRCAECRAANAAYAMERKRARHA